jgi:predicted Zn-dependent protease
MYTREQVKAITDKVINMAGTDAEVQFTGGERSGTRWANSSITTNLVQFDLNVTVTVRVGQRVGSASTRDTSDKGLKAMVDEAMAEARAAAETPNLPEWLGAQEYIAVDSALPSMTRLGPADMGRLVKESIDIAAAKGVVGAGFMPRNDIATCTANSKGLFAYWRSADLGFVLTCRMADGSGSGFASIGGVKDFSQLDVKSLTESASNKALRSRNAKALEPGRYTVILEPRASARFLSLMTGIFGTRGGLGGGFGGGPGGVPGAAAGAAPGAGAGAAAGAAAGGAAAAAGAAGGGGGGAGLFEQMGGAGAFMAGKKPGDKLFSDLFTLKSDVGNQILRQSPIGPDLKPAAPVTWVEKGVLRSLAANAPAGTNQSLVQEGSNLSVEEMIRQTRRGLLVTSFWYIRGVPSQQQPLLNTGMTRDGLFLIENGEIVGPAQNFRWNMSPLVAYNNLTLVGKPVPMFTGEGFDGGGVALVPPVRLEEFYMTSVSPAV